MGETILHPDLFGGETPIVGIKTFSLSPDGRHIAPPASGPNSHTCGDCMNWRGRTFPKCGLMKWDSSPATDINLEDPACVLWEPRCQSGLEAVRTFKDILERR